MKEIPSTVVVLLILVLAALIGVDTASGDDAVVCCILGVCCPPLGTRLPSVSLASRPSMARRGASAGRGRQASSVGGVSLLAQPARPPTSGGHRARQRRGGRPTRLNAGKRLYSGV